MDLRTLRLGRLTVLRAAVLTCCLALSTNSARAANPPDFATFSSTVDYNNTSGVLNVGGSTEQFSLPSTYVPPTYSVGYSQSDPWDWGQLSMSVKVDPTTGIPIQGQGTLSITGVLEDYNTGDLIPVGSLPPGMGTSGTLLTGNIDIAAGISAVTPSNDPTHVTALVLTFDLASGDAASLYPGSQAVVELELQGESAQAPWYSQNYSNDSNPEAQSDTHAVPVPEPSTPRLLAAFFAASLVMLAFRRLWKTRHST